MKRKHVPVLLLIGFIMAAISGCGGGGGGGDVTVGSGGAASGQALALNANSQLCATCHATSATPANRVADVYLGASGNIPAGTNPPTIVAEYSLSLHNVNTAATCQQCHMPTTPNAANHQGAQAPLASPDASGICLTCHSNLGLPHFNTAIVNTLSGFDGSQPAQFVDLANNAPGQAKCVACHNPHNTTTLMPTLRDYAASGHGDVNGGAWVHYRWKSSNKPGAGGAADPTGDRTQCQKCHNTDAFIAQVNGVRTGATSGASLVPSYTRKVSSDASGNMTWVALGATDVNSGLTGTSSGSSSLAGFRYYYTVFDVSGNSTRDNTKPVLRCDACHNDYGYSVRQATAVTPFYRDASTNVYKDTTGSTYLEATITDASGTIAFPSVGNGGSNLCLNCHVGRVNGYAIKTSTSNFANTGFINSHYLVAGGILYRTLGYTYKDVSANLTYDNSTSFRHKKMGSAVDYPTTGNNGPCVACHMYPGRHTFSPVKKDALGRIVDIVSPTCGSPTSACHAQAASTIWAEEVETQSTQFQAALYALKRQLETIGGGASGYYYNPGANPYFFTTSTYTTSVSNWTTAGDATGKNNMGAAFNLHILTKDVGAYTHNRRYAKRLIWDSLDWADDNNLNVSVGAAIDALNTAGKITDTQLTDARTYLCGSAGAAKGSTCATRP